MYYVPFSSKIFSHIHSLLLRVILTNVDRLTSRYVDFQTCAYVNNTHHQHTPQKLTKMGQAFRRASGRIRTPAPTPPSSSSQLNKPPDRTQPTITVDHNVPAGGNLDPSSGNLLSSSLFIFASISFEINIHL